MGIGGSIGGEGGGISTTLDTMLKYNLTVLQFYSIAFRDLHYKLVKSMYVFALRLVDLSFQKVTHPEESRRTIMPPLLISLFLTKSYDYSS